MAYKFKLTPVPILSRQIKEYSAMIAKSRNETISLRKKITSSLEKLKKANNNLTKFSVQKAKLKEKNPKLKNTYTEKKEKVKDLSAETRLNFVHLLKKIDSIVLDLKEIIFSADTLLYKENKNLNRLHKEIKKLKNKKLSAKTASQINILKQEIKSAARRLYESAKAPELLKKPFTKKATNLEKTIFELGIESASLEKALEKLNVNNIKEITKKAEKELDNLKKIELAVVSLVPEIKSHFAYIRSHHYLLEPSAAGRVEDRLSISEKKLDRILDKIESQAEKLFKEISIVKEIK